ncbi:MAG: flavodoxin family protein [Fidelibacterota bacterium]
MNLVVISECDNLVIPGAYHLALNKTAIRDCIGCWTCWWKTPGRCVYEDLNQFYHQYITADKAIYFAKVTKGFVSGNLKTLFDRMIPLYLSYTTYKTGESMHVPRYEKYPEIEFYYEGEFATDDARQIFIDYINRVFYQFYSKLIKIEPVGNYTNSGVNT